MSVEAANELMEYKWEPQPKAQALVDQIVDEFLASHRASADLAEKMDTETATRFKDWIDHIQLPVTPAIREALASVGFARDILRDVEQHQDQAKWGGTGGECWHHPGGLFPVINLSSEMDGVSVRVVIKVDSVSDFLACNGVTNEQPVYGEQLGSLRLARAFVDGDKELWAVERHGNNGFVIESEPAQLGLCAMKWLEALRRRPRDYFGNEQAGFDALLGMLDEAIADLGVDRTCDVFFEAERRYWMRRNRAAKVQYARQNKWGLGWANHDHHTFRTSREWFTQTISVLEKLGFFCRERFYAGAEAGWGAQVLEQSVTGIVIFCDVDMSADELTGDFAHTPLLAPRDVLGTIGLWCGLHGESMLNAGMHHLECVFDHHALVAQLEASHIQTMAPFTTFPYLRQAFTEGERWRIEDERIDRLVEKHFITDAQAAVFRAEGAIGSHLENLERNDGFKGFNQQGVSHIIAETDPRKQVIGA